MFQESTLLNPVRAWGLLFERSFEVVDSGGEDEFTELAIPGA